MTEPLAPPNEVLLVDRYFLFREIAAGGMASIHLARLLGPVGFGRTVAIKRLHPQYAKERDFVGMFVNEARIVTSIRHPNVVPVLDVVAIPGHLFLVMEYIHGEALHRLIATSFERQSPIPPGIVSAIGIHMLEGLHAAHEARGPGGTPLDVVHRDVSPQNVLVGADGLARVLDFGIAKATTQLHETTTGSAKGKLKYMAPEQVNGHPVDRRVDVWAASVVLWELLTLHRLFKGDNDGLVVRRILDMKIPPPSAINGSPAALDPVVLKGLARPVGERFADARSMALALEAACPPASAREVSQWLEALAGPTLREREKLLQELEETANAGLPSVRTQLEVLAENASRQSDVGEPPATAVSPADATAIVGGRPPSDAPSSTLDAPGLAAELGSAVAPPERRRSRPAVRVLSGVVVLGVLAAAAFVVGRQQASSPPVEPPAIANASVMSASTDRASSAALPSPPAPESVAQAPPAAPAPSPSTSTRPSATARKPVRSDRAPTSDGVRLDHRK